MRDRIWIIAALIVFVGLVTYPAWRSLEARTTSRPPTLLLPKLEKECVAPTPYMRSSHMKLLLDWRDSVVRDGQRQYLAFNGKTYEMSLTGTCLKCHDKQAFCDRCHDYAGVPTPYCWDCHVDPKLAPMQSGPASTPRTVNPSPSVVIPSEARPDLIGARNLAPKVKTGRDSSAPTAPRNDKASGFLPDPQRSAP